jgi:hypothetical protein
MRHGLIVTVVGTLLAVGCGGGGESISKEDFIEQADEICAAGSEELDAILDELEPATPTSDDIAEFLRDDYVPNIRAQIDDIRELGFPEGDEDELDAILDDSESVLDDIEEDPQTAVQQANPFAEVNQQLQEYGLTECGGGE